MAWSAQTAAMQAIALPTLSSPPTAQGTAEAIEEHVAHQPNSGITQQASNSVDDHANVRQAPTATPQPPPSGHLASRSPNVPVPCTDDSNSNNGRICRFLRNTTIGNAIGLLGLVLTLGLGLFGGIASYRDMKWSEHANAVQTCASLFSIGHFSEFCNSTIEDGIDTTPLSRRWERSTTSKDAYHLLSEMSPFALAGTVFCTITAGLLGLIFTRPRMQPFAPLISNVRLEVTIWMQGLRRVRCAPGSRVTADTLLLLEEELSKKHEELLRTGSLTEDSVDHILLFDDVEDLDVESIFEGFEEGGVDSKMSSSASDEILPKVRMAEAISNPANPEDIEDDIPVEGLEALVQSDLLNEDDSTSEVSSKISSLIAQYFDRRGDVLVYQERLAELDYEKREETEQRVFLRERDDAVELSDEEFDLKYQTQRQEIDLDLRTAQEESDILRQRCLDAGHDPDGYRISRDTSDANRNPRSPINLASTGSSDHSRESATLRKPHPWQQSDTEIADAKEAAAMADSCCVETGLDTYRSANRQEVPSELPRLLVSEYFDKAAELSKLRTRFSDLEFGHRSASDLRMLRRANGSELSITEEAFERSFSEQREAIKDLIKVAVKKCEPEAFDLRCIKEGLDPDRYVHIPLDAQQVRPTNARSRIEEWLRDIEPDPHLACTGVDSSHAVLNIGDTDWGLLTASSDLRITKA